MSNTFFAWNIHYFTKRIPVVCTEQIVVYKYVCALYYILRVILNSNTCKFTHSFNLTILEGDCLCYTNDMLWWFITQLTARTQSYLYWYRLTLNQCDYNVNNTRYRSSSLLHRAILRFNIIICIELELANAIKQ